MSDYGADLNPDTNRIRQVAHAYRLAPEPNLKVDQFSTPTTLKVYHCVRKHLSTRIQFLVDPAKLPAN